MAKDEWESTYHSTLDMCMHGVRCKKGRDCTYGKRTSSVCLLTGSVVQHWSRLSRYLLSQTQLPKSDRAMKVSKAALDDGSRLVGLRFPHTPTRLLRELMAPVVHQEHVAAPPRFVLDEASYTAFQSSYIASEYQKNRGQGLHFPGHVTMSLQLP